MTALLLAAWMAAVVAQPLATTSAVTHAAAQAPHVQIASQASGTIQSAGEVVDPMFGIHVRAIGLERVVRVRQWQPDAAAAGGYNQVWSSERIGPQGLDAAHANPAEFPINGQRWWAQDAKLDGRPVATDVLTALEADADARQGWSAFNPDFSRLPPNLAVTFQPDGAMLTTSQDSAHPQVGDVQVQWRTIVSAPAPAGVQLADGRWVMPASGAASTVASAASEPSRPLSPVTQDDAWAWLRRLFGDATGWFVIAGVVLAIAALASRRRGRRRRR